MHFPKSCEIWWSSLNSQSFMSLFSLFLCNLPLCVQSKFILQQHVLFSLPLHPITSVMYICSFSFPNRVNSRSTLYFKAPAIHYYWIGKKKLLFLMAFVVETSFCFDTKISWFGRDAPSSSNQAWVHDTLGSPCHLGAVSLSWVHSSLPRMKQETETKMVTKACLNFSSGVWVAKLHHL